MCRRSRPALRSSRAAVWVLARKMPLEYGDVKVTEVLQQRAIAELMEMADRVLRGRCLQSTEPTCLRGLRVAHLGLSRAPADPDRCEHALGTLGASLLFWSDSLSIAETKPPLRRHKVYG
jgi:hypothetical protein